MATSFRPFGTRSARIDTHEWSRMVNDLGRTFKNVAGKLTGIEQARSLKSRSRFYVSHI